MANDRLPNPATLPTCPTLLPSTDTSVPGVNTYAVLATNPNQATRNFDCVGDVPATYSEYTASLSDAPGLWWGNLTYDSNGFPTYNLVFQDEYDDYKQYPRTVVTFKEFTEVPSPTGAAPWARYKVMSDTGSPPMSYVERTKTTGGVPPANCSGQASVQIPYSATYNFYWCKEDAAAPSPAPVALSPPMMMMSPPVAVPPSPTAAVPPSPSMPVVVPSPAVIPSPVPVAPSPSPAEVSPSTVSPSPAPSPPSSSLAASVSAIALAAVLAAVIA